MARGKPAGPSHFCEWAIGTTIPSILGPIPKPKKPKRRDVVRIEVTTDDESEEDTVKITYPRTGRTNHARNNVGINHAVPEATDNPTSDDSASDNPDSTVKKVRFEDNTKDAPKKSALKKSKPCVGSAETSDSGTSQAADSEAESSDNTSESASEDKKQQKKQNISSDDADSEYDPNPHPTCKCQRCANGRQWLGKRCKKCAKEWSDNNNTEISESESEGPPAKGKTQAPINGEKNGGKKPATDEGTSKQKSEKSAKVQAKNKSANSKGSPKNEESTADVETSESEPDTSSKHNNPSKSAKSAKPAKPSKKGNKKSETDGETSDSARETDEDTAPTKKKGTVKSGGGKKKQEKQNDKQKKKVKNDIRGQVEDEEEVSPRNEKSKHRKGEKFEEPEKESSKKLKHRDGHRKGNHLEALPSPHYRRPNLIEPIRAEVVQTERVVETPEDPAPNAYFDQANNIVRVYYGPVYGNHHGSALYPSRNANNQPLPMGVPHPTQNPYYYGFNNQQQPKHPPPPPPQGYGYSHVPVTQGVLAGPWSAPVPPAGLPPGVPPGYAGNHVNQPHGHWMQGGGGTYMMSGGAGGPPPSKDKDKDGVNNVGPEVGFPRPYIVAVANMIQENQNPYLPKRAKSQFSYFGNASQRHASKETRKSGKEGGRTGSNPCWSNNDGAGEHQSRWGENSKGNDWAQNSKEDDGGWGQPNNSQQGQDTWAGSAKNSHRSNDTVQKKGDHWGEDTHMQARYTPDDWDHSRKESEKKDSDENDWNDKKPEDDIGGFSQANNVMPGSWVDNPLTTPAVAHPPWGDPSAAADTGGMW
ncbi:hypothetical protein B0J13DRAFT_602503 [Dactylonectria estremocensis]|uniref:Uncharacterized protein n=1 Tax=Dactylonectria estremocensis TaxID=1079267 RepID=A0A9P9FDY3_9HYPO|nr:hypothetical protein B0J13DRAFT_602503 [Dactylonectria estremocensis]